ncbi:hypothetical protein CY35_02G000900 [Sphagnum magellanicum]|nr:hypothetical protein CY35_02G000900 [Sphagnum magellanicum]
MRNLAVEKSLYCTFLCYLRSFSGLKDVHFSFSNHLKNGASIDMLKRVGTGLLQWFNGQAVNLVAAAKGSAVTQHGASYSTFSWILRSLCIQRPSGFSLQKGQNLCGRCMGYFQGGGSWGVQGHSIHHYICRSWGVQGCSIHHYICRSCCSCSTAALGNSYMQSNTGYCIG